MTPTKVQRAIDHLENLGYQVETKETTTYTGETWVTWTLHYRLDRGHALLNVSGLAAWLYRPGGHGKFLAGSFWDATDSRRTKSPKWWRWWAEMFSPGGRA